MGMKKQVRKLAKKMAKKMRKQMVDDRARCRMFWACLQNAGQIAYKDSARKHTWDVKS